MTNPEETDDAPRVSPDVAAALVSMTQWRGDHTECWRAALAQTRSRSQSFRIVPSSWIQAVAAVMIVAVLVGILLPSLGKARSSNRVASASSAPTSMSLETRVEIDQASSVEHKEVSGDWLALAGSPPERALSPSAQPRDTARHVIRKATIELKTKHTRAVFAKAALIISEANGEYVESSSLTGDEEDELQAQMTLRVASARLSIVLSQLRELGAVVNERSSGEDVTDAVVDLEARLRNEQRVETELLQLLESRRDASLKDVLDLRSEIAGVRNSIERLTAQRERLARLVSLATVLVIIHPDSTRPAPLPDGIGDYFLKQVGAAWQGSLALLSDSVAFLIQVFVGGAVFWIAGIAIITGIVAIRRRALRRVEPAPRL